MTDQEMLEHYQSPLEERSEHAVHELEGAMQRISEIIQKREGIRLLRRQGERLQGVSERLFEVLMQLSASNPITIRAEAAE